MTPSINAVNFTLGPHHQEFIDGKLKRIAYAEDLIVDLMMKIKFENETFDAETTVNFKWGTSAHVSAQDKDFQAAINKMMDVLDNKVKKEKDKVQGR